MRICMNTCVHMSRFLHGSNHVGTHISARRNDSKRYFVIGAFHEVFYPDCWLVGALLQDERLAGKHPRLACAQYVVVCVHIYMCLYVCICIGVCVYVSCIMYTYHVYVSCICTCICNTCMYHVCVSCTCTCIYMYNLCVCINTCM